MITEYLVSTVFDLLRFVMGYFPYDDQLVIAERVLDIYGFSVYMLGATFYSRLIYGIVTLIFLKVTWRFVLFAFNAIRGSGV